MTREEYAAYRQTAPWLDRVAQLHLWAGERCQGTRLVWSDTTLDREQRCAETTRLHAHHVFYDRLGHEAPGDLLLLCVRCHLVAHLVSVECPCCGVPALEDWEAWALIDALEPEDLAAPDVFHMVFHEARYAVGHWPFCQACHDLMRQEG